mmetsp:Transcript_66902/g.211801  ORF Transcript_66902/g.211801 Transcript_66902/m.211801 type:complete len:209 (+) Transcript_66902:403-1029(+)
MLEEGHVGPVLPAASGDVRGEGGVLQAFLHVAEERGPLARGSRSAPLEGLWLSAPPGDTPLLPARADAVENESASAADDAAEVQILLLHVPRRVLVGPRDLHAAAMCDEPKALHRGHQRGGAHRSHLLPAEHLRVEVRGPHPGVRSLVRPDSFLAHHELGEGVVTPRGAGRLCLLVSVWGEDSLLPEHDKHGVAGLSRPDPPGPARVV